MLYCEMRARSAASALAVERTCVQDRAALQAGWGTDAGNFARARLLLDETRFLNDTLRTLVGNDASEASSSIRTFAFAFLSLLRSLLTCTEAERLAALSPSRADSMLHTSMRREGLPRARA